MRNAPSGRPGRRFGSVRLSPILGAPFGSGGVRLGVGGVRGGLSGRRGGRGGLETHFPADGAVVVDDSARVDVNVAAGGRERGETGPGCSRGRRGRSSRIRLIKRPEIRLKEVCERIVGVLMELAVEIKRIFAVENGLEQLKRIDVMVMVVVEPVARKRLAPEVVLPRSRGRRVHLGLPPRVAQHLIGLGDLLELFGGFRMVVLVRMVLFGLFPVCLFDVGLRGVLADPQHLVVVFIANGHDVRMIWKAFIFIACFQRIITKGQTTRFNF